LAPPAFARYEEIHTPTLVLVGQLDNRDCCKIADELCRRIPGVEKKCCRASVIWVTWKPRSNWTNWCANFSRGTIP